MQGGGSVLLASFVAVLLAVGPVGPVGCMAAVGGSRGGQNAPEGVLTRPLRPAQFHTPEELRHYLDAVSNYYAVASRPGRFGKRSSHLPHRAGGALLAAGALEERLPLGLGQQRRDRDNNAALDNNDQALEALERGLERGLERERGMDTADALPMPDYLYQFAPGPAPSPASEVYPLFLEQERLPQPRQNQMQE